MEYIRFHRPWALRGEKSISLTLKVRSGRKLDIDYCPTQNDKKYCSKKGGRKIHMTLDFVRGLNNGLKRLEANICNIARA